VSKPVRIQDLLQALERDEESRRGVPSAGPKSVPVLDDRLVNGLRELGLLEEVSQAFLEEWPSRFDSLRDAVEAGQFDRVEREAHALKGSSATIGAARIAFVFAQIEQMGEDKRLDGARLELTRLAMEMQALKKAFAVAIRVGA